LLHFSTCPAHHVVLILFTLLGVVFGEVLEIMTSTG